MVVQILLLAFHKETVRNHQHRSIYQNQRLVKGLVENRFFLQRLPEVGSYRDAAIQLVGYKSHSVGCRFRKGKATLSYADDESFLSGVRPHTLKWLLAAVLSVVRHDVMLHTQSMAKASAASAKMMLMIRV